MASDHREALERLESEIVRLDGRITKAGPTRDDMFEPGFSSRDRDTWRSLKLLYRQKVQMEKEQDDTMKALTEAVTAVIEAQNSDPLHRQHQMLTEPLSLTVKKRDGSYSKRPHVGGEEFCPVKAYAGKRGKLIYVFKPLAAADYLEMEMDEAQAKRSLSGFKEWLDTVFDYELASQKKEAIKAVSLAAEREKLATRVDQYANLGFGSW